MRIYPDLTQDAEFKALGDAGFDGALNDRQYQFLRDKGYTGSLSDMMYLWLYAPELITNGTFDTDVSGWTALGVDGGTDTTFSWNASGYMDVTRGVGGISDMMYLWLYAPELITNGTFDTDVSGWTALGVDGGTDTTFSWNASGYMDVTRGVGGISGRPEQGFPTTAGNIYTISIDIVTARRAFWMVGSSSGQNNLVGVVVHNGNTTVTRTFTATSSTSYVNFWTDNSATTGVDNVSVRKIG